MAEMNPLMIIYCFHMVTLVLLLFNMAPLSLDVEVQLVLFVEGLATNFAVKILDPGMHPPDVPVQMPFFEERVLANGALVWPVVEVVDTVILQLTGGIERLITIFTGEVHLDVLVVDPLLVELEVD